MLALPGFIEANYFDPERTEDGRWTHTVQYIVSSQEALDAYLENDAPRMRRDGIERFGDALEASRSIRDLVAEDDGARCLNCDVVLRGQYCWNCGQRGNARLISLFELLKDAFGDMFELDSRLWRTLIPLATKPGKLTSEYLLGRRARYMPPFRMYLVLSFLFFLLARVLGDGVGVTVDGDFAEGVSAGVEAGNADNVPEDLTQRLEAAGVAPEDAAEFESRLESAQAEAGRVREAAGEEDDFSCNISLDNTGIGWIDRQFSEERVDKICEDLRRDKGKRLIERWTENSPVAALAMLPLMAMLLKAMYPLSRRYYVEHLLMLVHFHSFLFLLFSAGLGFNALAGWSRLPEAAVITVNVAGWLFVPYYLYRSLRVVYGQGRLATILKFLVMLLGYLAAVVFVIAITFIYLFATY
jgi:hypothetical protein